jgi:large subunit ribosomal protein L24|tara:strand:+ start:1438 stop:1755 length:318 start_codon:yes stop_codon:yes gene_type:complete
MNKIKTGDSVIVIAGKDKGKQGSITKILSNGRCYVSGVQMVKRHTKPNPQAGIAGGVIEKEASINVSNISIFNPSSKKADKVAIKTLEDGTKVRVFRSTGKEINS